MAQLSPYLSFGGNCEEALRFYQSCFGGEVQIAMRWGQGPMDIPETIKNWVMHASLQAPGITLMASDSPPDRAPQAGSNLTLSLGLTDVAEQDAIWNKLSQGGTVTMPLAEQFWGARFGMLTDKYGFHWMLNCELAAARK